MKESERPPGDTSMSFGSTAMPTASAMSPLGATSISCGAILISVGSTCAAQQSVSVSQQQWVLCLGLCRLRRSSAPAMPAQIKGIKDVRSQVIPLHGGRHCINLKVLGRSALTDRVGS